MDVELPAVGDRRLAVRVSNAALRSLRDGHPWVFGDSVQSTSHDAPSGDLAVVFDQRRKFVAVGLWEPDGPIRVRVLQHRIPATVDAEFWSNRLAAAVERRAPLWRDQPASNLGIRLVNGENDGFGGLIVDRYSNVAVIKVYAPAWWPHFASIVAAVEQLDDVNNVVVRLGNNADAPAGIEDGLLVRATDGGVSVETPGPELRAVEFMENGLRFAADVVDGQKTGWFLDQRANRERVGRLAKGADVLDVFCAGGGFSVHAAAAGAKSVLSIDAAAPAIAACQANHRRNDNVPAVAACRHEVSVGDAFSELDELVAKRQRFDVVVVDPPSFARKASQVAGATKAYAALSQRAIPLVRPGGVLVQASCSARIGIDVVRAGVEEAAAGVGRTVEELWTSGHDIDHPVTFPEGEYLCAGAWRIGAGGARSTMQR